MIPTLILFGAVLGRWWRSALVAAALIWPLVLALGGAAPTGRAMIAGSGLAVTNTLVGVLAHQTILRLVRRQRQRGERRSDASPAASGG